ncbi:MAG: glycine zipper domain-containing protein [Gammaproteobacteria bacterium]
MKILQKIAYVLIPCALLVGGAASAGPPHKGQGKGPPGFVGKKDKGYGHHDRDYRYVRRYGYSGGPPPWAPAHGYRRKQGHGHHYASLPVNVRGGQCNREVIGQVLGGATGAVVGSQIGDGTGRLIAVATGTLVGAVIGGEIGRYMDRADRLCMDQALEHAPDGTRIRWNDDNRQYTVTPHNTREYDNGRYCREYHMEAGVGGRTEQVYGRACRQEDGAWQIVS